VSHTFGPIGLTFGTLRRGIHHATNNDRHVPFAQDLRRSMASAAGLIPVPLVSLGKGGWCWTNCRRALVGRGTDRKSQIADWRRNAARARARARGLIMSEIRDGGVGIHACVLGCHLVSNSVHGHSTTIAVSCCEEHVTTWRTCDRACSIHPCHRPWRDAENRFRATPPPAASRRRATNSTRDIAFPTAWYVAYSRNQLNSH
jgi:hypothetical protein